MKKICNSYEIDTMIKSKFVRDPETGNYTNLRLKEEIEKRKKYSESRANNRKAKKEPKKDMINICSSHDQHMENEDIIYKSTNITTDINTKEQEDIQEEEYHLKETISKKKRENFLKETFDKFRIAYPGKKRGIDTEFENLKKKHKDYAAVIPELERILKAQYYAKQQNILNGHFESEWQNLQTYINQRSWEIEIEIKQPKNGQRNGKPSLSDNLSTANSLIDQMFAGQQ